MRALVGIVSLLVVLAIVGLLAQKQMGGTTGAAPHATPQPQSLQLPQQVQQSVEGAMQQARPMPDDTK